MNRLVLMTATLLSATGCGTLDGFIFNPVHCSIVNEETCTRYGNAWDDICVPCDEEYDWQRTYPWIDGTLDEQVPSVRPVETQVERLAFSTSDGEAELDAYFLPAHGDDGEYAATTILYQHGNYAGLEHYSSRIRMLHEAGFNVLAWDYRGYGKSLPSTAPSPEDFVGDALEVRDWADGIVPDPDRIVIYGNSIGAIPSIHMSVYSEPCALMLEVPFTSLGRVARSNTTLQLREQFLSAGLFDNPENVRSNQAPLLGMHGTLDNKFPIEDVRDLIANNGGPSQLWELEGVRHGINNGGVPEAGLGPYNAQMKDFLRESAPGCLTP